MKQQAVQLPPGLANALKLRKGRALMSFHKSSEDFKQKLTIECLTAKYLTPKAVPKAQTSKIETLKRTARRLYDNGFCRKYLETPGTPLMIRRKKKHFVLHVTDLWSDLQNKLLLRETGLYSPRSVKSLSRMPSPPNGAVSKSRADQALLLRSRTQLVMVGSDEGYCKPVSPRELTSRLDKVITDCEREKLSHKTSLRPKTQAVNKPKTLERLKKSELKQISYYLATL
jgi:hypothetical protein